MICFSFTPPPPPPSPTQIIGLSTLVISLPVISPPFISPFKTPYGLLYKPTAYNRKFTVSDFLLLALTNQVLVLDRVLWVGTGKKKKRGGGRGEGVRKKFARFCLQPLLQKSLTTKQQQKREVFMSIHRGYLQGSDLQATNTRSE